jgi:hypothetical protein
MMNDFIIIIIHLCKVVRSEMRNDEVGEAEKVGNGSDYIG